MGDPEYFIQGPGRLTSALEMLKCQTIVASDNDVSNGFVKNGKKLPYVFQAGESGLGKKWSKILPVCGVCGKRFVCVTTMKRHLVTHTGEKPFSCKICGKQYTQKGNLRVHERTHRNDRPFECNICHQKFYRKEPMQKHQWRQHAVIRYKSTPKDSSEMGQTLPGTIEKPCLKHKMKLAQAYLKEQNEQKKPIITPILRSDSEVSNPLFLLDESRTFFSCNSRGNEFCLKNDLRKNRCVIEIDDKLSYKPSMTFTMQELIDRGVEKSMMRNANDQQNYDIRQPREVSPQQPLDLSPAKSESSREDLLTSRANNPLLNNCPAPSDETFQLIIPSSLKRQKVKSDESSQLSKKLPSILPRSPFKFSSWKSLPMSQHIKSSILRGPTNTMHLQDLERPQDGRTV